MKPKKKPSLDDYISKLMRDMADKQRHLDIKLEAMERVRDQLDPGKRKALVASLWRIADELINHANNLERPMTPSVANERRIKRMAGDLESQEPGTGTRNDNKRQ